MDGSILLVEKKDPQDSLNISMRESAGWGRSWCCFHDKEKKMFLLFFLPGGKEEHTISRATEIEFWGREVMARSTRTQSREEGKSWPIVDERELQLQAR